MNAPPKRLVELLLLLLFDPDALLKKPLLVALFAPLLLPLLPLLPALPLRPLAVLFMKSSSRSSSCSTLGLWGTVLSLVRCDHEPSKGERPLPFG